MSVTPTWRPKRKKGDTRPTLPFQIADERDALGRVISLSILVPRKTTEQPEPAKEASDANEDTHGAASSSSSARVASVDPNSRPAAAARSSTAIDLSGSDSDSGDEPIDSQSHDNPYAQTVAYTDQGDDDQHDEDGSDAASSAMED